MASASRHLLTVYLAGPITGFPYATSLAWRRDLVADLAEHAPHLTCLDPLRAKEHLAELELVPDEAGPGSQLGNAGVVARDLWDIDRADVVLINLLGATTVSVGAMVELGWATAKGKLVMVMLDDDSDNPHNHLFVRELASVLVSSVEAAATVLRDL